MKNLNTVTQAILTPSFDESSRSKIKGGRGITVHVDDIDMPDFRHLMEFDYQGRPACLVIDHEWQRDSRSYSICLNVRLNGMELQFKEKSDDWMDLWTEAGYALWDEIERQRRQPGEGVFALPAFLVEMIEEQLDAMAHAESLT